jgi:PAS domain S-box-containing protein
VKRNTLSERALVHAPRGRDAAIAADILEQAGISATVCPSLPLLIDELNAGAAFVVVTEEALAAVELTPIATWLAEQEEWSDLPFVLLTNRGGGLERNPTARRFLDVLGNVTFLERPFHQTTLISLARAALRGRRRQYDARARLKALREGEARYRTLFENIDEGFCIIQFLDGPHGRLSDYVHVEANPAYAIHTGIPDVVGQKIREMVPQEAQGWIELYRRVLEIGDPFRFERELIATGRYLELAAFRVEPADRKQVAVIFRDITERKQAEVALRELNETLERRVAEALAERKVFADLIEGTDAFVQVADLDYRWIAINKAAADEFERMFGLRPKVGQSMLDVLVGQPEHRDAVKAVWSRALAGESFTEIGELGNPSRDRRHYEMKLNVLRNATGGRVGAYQFAYDVTDRIREQKRLRDAEAQLRQSQKMEAMGQLTGGVAHDFNNLLTPIVGALDLLQRRGVGGEREQRLIAGAIQSSERAKTLVQRLLAFARRQPLQPTAVNIAQLVKGMADLIGSTSGPQIKVVVEVGDDPLPAKGDPNQLEMALLNLSVNARDAMPDGGTLRISASEEKIGAGHKTGLQVGRYVRLSVADTGIGMDEATLARAIEPFFSTKGVGKGTGLGLSMVHGLAVQLGGTLTIQSRRSVGTNIELWLPVSDVPAETAGGVAGAAPPLTAEKTALLVDDEELVRVSTADMLSDLGYKVVEASSAEEALKLIRDGVRPDLLVSDHLMSGMNGTDLARIVRSERPEVQVLIVSGYAESEGIEPDLPRLTKPFRNDELAACLSNLQASH